ncbi:hypothetical protein P12x_005855 [Tundrisphaera lichenicola]|uniref:hypothetical protein n=1 Tax=Tundrisphaera lichenicola TaxID=2029860 RepID=UPI003EBCF91D
MLRIEPQRRYIVYPSWAEGQMPCGWAVMPDVLADPENSGFLDDNDRIFLEANRGLYPAKVQPSVCLDGPWGGGVIAVQTDPHPQRWLPDLAIPRIGNTRTPAMMLHPPGFRLPVTYLEPMSDTARGHEFLGRAPRLYPTIMTVEHVEAEADGAYLVVVHKPGKLPGLPNLAVGFNGFGLALEGLKEAPRGLEAEIAPWFDGKSGLTRAWFRLQARDEGLGLIFAVTIYVALHLRSVAGNRLISTHLVGNIEGKPNFIRQAWGR